jgi:hypothetical protein
MIATQNNNVVSVETTPVWIKNSGIVKINR